MLDAIDHTAIAVTDLGQAIRFYTETLGLTLTHRETIADQGIEAALLGIGDAHIELLAPTGPDTTVARFLQRRGPGLHHIAYRVPDIEVALTTLTAAGVQLIDQAPRTGIRGSRVAFLHPSATGGVLTEIVQPAEH